MELSTLKIARLREWWVADDLLDAAAYLWASRLAEPRANSPGLLSRDSAVGLLLCMGSGTQGLAGQAAS